MEHKHLLIVLDIIDRRRVAQKIRSVSLKNWKKFCLGMTDCIYVKCWKEIEGLIFWYFIVLNTMLPLLFGYLYLSVCFLSICQWVFLSICHLFLYPYVCLFSVHLFDSLFIHWLVYMTLHSGVFLLFVCFIYVVNCSQLCHEL